MYFCRTLKNNMEKTQELVLEVMKLMQENATLKGENKVLRGMLDKLIPIEPVRTPRDKVNVYPVEGDLSTKS